MTGARVIRQSRERTAYSPWKGFGVWPRINGLRAFGLGSPGEMRERLNALVLAGSKTATAGLWKDEYEPEGEMLDQVGERQVMLDCDEGVAAVIEITRVETHRFDEVPWEFAEAEGEGFRDIDDWRSGHRSFYAEQSTRVADSDLVVCVWMKVVEGHP